MLIIRFRGWGEGTTDDVATRLSIIVILSSSIESYEGWNFNSGNYLFTTDTK